MAYTIRVANSEIIFRCEPGTTILDAAQAAGYEMPYSCRNGVCHNCRGHVTSGAYEGPRVEDGATLFCQARPSGDLEIAPRTITKREPHARKIIEATVYRLTRPVEDVVLLQLRFPAGTKVKFKAGQYLQVIFEDGKRRSFSMANPPQQNDGAQLHVRLIPGGKFCESVVPRLVPGAKLRVELPYGDFFLREDSKPAIFVASGTGFAPIKSILEDAFRRGVTRAMVLYWGARKRKDLYALELPASWSARHANFHFVPVLSEPDADWPGRIGFVHRAVMEDVKSLADHQVYACGVSAMVEAARRDFLGERGLPAGAFYCDAFVTPADRAVAQGLPAPTNDP